ncbi:S1 RNA-binding domain-containing protein [Brevibacillus marinus]|uniref:S1 RNA-binding domain-containing protein n=1 Tax=Brevibacillus marinus TaxID=2496837 RepID=UPI001F49CB29|nr:S1 RNA-binding domain-containing protein [Brevibacillus marinus]
MSEMEKTLELNGKEGVMEMPDVTEYQPIAGEEVEEQNVEEMEETQEQEQHDTEEHDSAGIRQAKTLRVIVEGYDPSRIVEEDNRVDETWKEIYRAYQNSMIVQARIIGIEHKLGQPCAVVGLNHVRGYIPMELTGFASVAQLKSFIGEVIAFKVLSYDRDNDVFTASRVAAIEHMAGLTWKRIAEGQVAPAVIRKVESKWLKVEIGGIVVNVPVTEVDHGWVDDLRDVYSVGDQIKVLITKVDREKKEVKVSIKALKPDPWPDCTRRYRLYADYVGTVSGIEEYGVFVRLEKGVDSLCRHPRLRIKLKKGDQVIVRITNVDPKNKRFSGKILRGL